jgi:RNA polymerase sigma factor (sigma-70 family)
MDEDNTVVVRSEAGGLTVGPAVDFETFFATEAPQLFRALRLLVGSTQEAEDLMQEAFFKVWRRWDRIGGMDDPTGYLYRTAMNLHRSAYRRVHRAIKQLPWLSSTDDPSIAVEARDEFARWLAGLTPKQRSAVVLTELSGYSAEQAAQAMRVKPATVYVLISQARASLRVVTEATNE